ncbi:MAG: membrane-bound lytic murein transglycosylase MltF [Nitrospirota bacterium]
MWKMASFMKSFIFLFFFLFFVSIIGCPETSNKKTEEKKAASSEDIERYGGDLHELRAKKRLRIIVREEPIASLPRNAEPVSLDREIAEDIAKELGLNLTLIVVEDYAQMIDKLIQGEGDIIASGLAVTKSRTDRLAFSTPYLYTDELLITQVSSTMPGKLEDMQGIQVCVRKSSSYFDALTNLIRNKKILIDINEMPENLNTEEIIDKVARGECFSTVADSNLWTAISRSYDNLIASVIITNARPIALAMRQESTVLKQKVNEFLIARALTGHRQEVYTDDMDKLKERKVIRMITRNNAMTYFIYRGMQMGFEYELIKRFADQHKMRLEIVIPPGHADLIPWLNEGRGDIIAAAMTITEERSRQALFTNPYNYIEEVVVVREDNNDIAGPDDLEGKTIYIRKSSSFYNTLLDLQKRVHGLNIAFISEDIETEEILAGIEQGKWEITVSDSNLLEVEQTYGRKIKSAFSLKKTRLGWAVHNQNRKLQRALNDYIKKEYRGLFYNMMKKRYFNNKKNISKAHNEFRSDLSGRISPYDDIVKKHAVKYDLDWRLIVSQMYQESKFDPDRVSWAGAVGLMQLMPRTAKELGVKHLKDPEASIHAGIKYVHNLIQRFDPKIELKDRIRFALASYNAGMGHVVDARRLASRMGLSSNKWFGNVEKAMLLLEKPKYYRRTSYGYCRGSEPVKYVSSIQSRYDAYVEHLQDNSS